MRRPELSISQILAWTDFYHGRTGRWPQTQSRFVYNAVGEKWRNLNAALSRGWRGLPGKSSLAQLLAERRGVRNMARLPPFREKTIAAWADAYYRRHQRWPTKTSGTIPEALGEKWSTVNAALCNGRRGLPGKSSLSQLLAERRGVRNPKGLPSLRAISILAWADTYFRRHQRWPKHDSGSIAEVPGETWSAVNAAFHQGLRGLPKGFSLARFLERHRRVRNHLHLPRLTLPKILAWADAVYKRTGKWPTANSGCIHEAPGETWSKIHSALKGGNRGLPGGSSLARLLQQHRGVPNHLSLPPLTHRQILRWADAFHWRTGHWPKVLSGPIPEAPGLTWAAVNSALNQGYRGLRAGYSLFRLLRNRRGAWISSKPRRPPFDIKQLLAATDRFHQRSKHWPGAHSGPIAGLPGET